MNGREAQESGLWLKAWIAQERPFGKQAPNASILPNPTIWQPPVGAASSGGEADVRTAANAHNRGGLGD
jgi:hypothetical protein